MDSKTVTVPLWIIWDAKCSTFRQNLSKCILLYLSHFYDISRAWHVKSVMICMPCHDMCGLVMICGRFAMICIPHQHQTMSGQEGMAHRRQQILSIPDLSSAYTTLMPCLWSHHRTPKPHRILMLVCLQKRYNNLVTSQSSIVFILFHCPGW